MPCSTIRPLSITTIFSAYFTVHMRWAENTTVLCCINCCKLAKSFDSDSMSNALVGSSINRILGFFIRQRAKAILCFWPPETKHPRSPTCFSYPTITNDLLYYQFSTMSSTQDILVYFLNRLLYFCFSPS